MTSELAQAIANYANTGSGLYREIVVSLVREGHLTPVEYKRLRWALEPHMETTS